VSQPANESELSSFRPSTPDGVPAVLAALRAGTRELHERFDHGLGLVGPITPERYRAVLEAFLGYYQPLEENLARVQGLRESGYDVLSNQRVPRLRRDLLALGLAHEALSRLPLSPQVPAPASVPEAFGCLYVLEGASLGGQIISRHVRQHLGLGPDNGVTFFHGHGAETGPRWKAFVGLLDRVAGHPDDIPRVVGGARATFLLFEQWLRTRGILT